MVIDTDLSASHPLQSRAAAVLQATHVRHGGTAERSAPSAARGALTPWQLDRIWIYIEDNIAEPLPNTDLRSRMFAIEPTVVLPRRYCHE